MTMQEFQIRQIPAHEVYGDFWFNSEPMPIAALRGRVVLLDFWDYTSCSSLRTLPYVREWHRRYEEHGLVVVGVHTPMFPFGKNPAVVEQAIRELGIQYPVVMDNEAMIWSSYGTRAWPTKFLIDKDGFVRCMVAGEGNYAALEQAIHSMLYHAGISEELPLIMDPVRESDRTGAVSYRATPELFAGYLKGSVGNVEGYSPESVVEYADPDIYYDGRFYLSGDWLNGRNMLRYQGGPERVGAIILDYQALEVNAVITTEDGKPFELLVQQDGGSLSPENRGEDVALTADGKSIVRVAGPRMYNLVRNREFGEHVVRMATRSNSCGLYALTFVSSLIPEMVSHN
jgi:thiol-disulfide isomerase/thioredoxin